MIELRLLSYFLVVAREENITRAAQRLHITQPTLSRQLMQLEEQLGTKLFHRSRHRILLTDDGMLLKRRAQEILELAAKAERELAHEETVISGEIAIGCGETENMRPLTYAMRTFRQRYPDVYFYIYTAIADDVKERIETGSLDMGLLLEPVEISQYHYLHMPLEEEWYALMRRDCPLAEKEEISPQDLAAYPLILAKRPSVHNELVQWFGPHYDRLDIAAYHNLSYNNCTLMVREGLGIATVHQFNCTAPDLCLRPFSPSRKTGTVLVWKKNQPLSAAMQAFITHCGNAFEAYLNEKDKH